ncbi:MAG: fibronectin type III domain-containing protein, partial [Chloroflexi bacterium]|nr:fibronectin type III domain-containing protein [Chloroflexota bacterium]
APAAPTSLTTSGITQTAITLNWTKSATATTYEVNGGALTEWTDVGDVATYQFTGLTADTAYTLQVRASNAGGDSAAASVIARTLVEPEQDVPDPPTDLVVNVIGQNSATMSWEKSPNADSYEVFAAEIGTTVDWQDVGDVDNHVFSDLNPDEDYALGVHSVSAMGMVSETRSEMIHTMPMRESSRQSAPARDDGGGGGSAYERYVPKPTATPIQDTLNRLPPGIQVNNWVSGAQGRRVGLAGVGRADLIERGVLDAIDIWGYVTPGTEVCFQQSGQAVFLDAAYMPRRLFDLRAFSRNGMTCARIDRAGTVVLLRGDPPPPQSVVALPLNLGVMLDGCEVKPWDALNFRESPPNGAIIGVTSHRDWLPASEKRAGYFKIRMWGRAGWISGDYVYTRGNCGG